jgi:chloramphenicol-sensitive protein RarD
VSDPVESDDPRGQLSSGIRSAVLAYSMWGGFTAYWKLLADFAPFDLVGWRIASATLVLVVLLVARGTWGNVGGALADPRTRRRLALASALLAVNWSTYVFAVVSDRVLETALGYFLAPLITMAIGVLVLGERLTPMKRAAAVLAIASILITSISYGAVPWVAVFLGGSWAWYGLTKRRVPLGPVDSLGSEVLLLMPLASVVVVISLVRDGGVVDSASAGVWPWLGLLGTGVVTAAPLLLFAHAAKRVPFTLFGPIGWLVPIINLLLGWIAYGESMPALRLIGFALVWAALVGIAIETVRAERSRSAALSTDHR